MKVVGIAAGRRYENYLNWLLQSADVKVIRLSHEDHNFDRVGECNGFVLCGGEDVHPRFYGKSEYVSEYNLDDLDEARDEFEINVLQYAEQHQKPVLGICRGLQLANAFYGGTLIPDIPSFGMPDHTKFGEGRDRYHRVLVEKGTLLREIAGLDEGEVNSAHHQAVDAVAPGFRVNAVSPDGVVEGTERIDRDHHPFLLLVQWHPERLKDQQSAFTKNIRLRFLEHVVSQ